MLKAESSITRRTLVGAFFTVILLVPLTAFGQSLIVVRHRHRNVVVYQTRPNVIYQRPYNTYYSNPYYSNGYTQPYYGSSYYSSNYSQPYYVNPYAYSVTPSYSYGYSTYRPRYRRNRVRVGLWLR